MVERSSDQVVKGHDCHSKELEATRQQGTIRKTLNKGDLISLVSGSRCGFTSGRSST